MTEELLDGLVVPEYEKWCHSSDDSPIRLQPACWPYFPWRTLPNHVKASLSRQCRLCSGKKLQEC